MRHAIKDFVLLWLFALTLSTSMSSFAVNIVKVQPSDQPFTLSPLAENLGIIWGMSFLDKDRLIFTQRSGKAGILNINTQQVTNLTGLPEVHAQSQGGLLDVKVSPHFQQTGWIYFTYSKPTFLSAVTTLARAKLSGHHLTQWQDLLVTDSEGFQNIHFGSRIAFDHQGHLFFSVGDRGSRNNAQDFSNHSGSILRLNLDGSLPTDNPFIGDDKALDEIWSVGHRNPQGLVFDQSTNRLWSIEHGPRGGDEINLIQKGGNYGWPIVSQGKEYVSGSDVGVKHKAGMIDPKKFYTPSIAPSDLIIYQGNEFPEWRGDLFSGALVKRHLNRIQLDANGLPITEYRYLTQLKQRVRSLATDPQGRFYVATDAGIIYQLNSK